MIRNRTHRGERGAFLLIFALCLTIILLVVAMTVDLGQARFSKRNEQQLADLASISAGRQLAGYGAPQGGIVISRPQDACIAAMQSIRTNASDFNPTNGQISAACAVLPVSTAACVAAETPTAPVNATLTDPPYAVTVRWPVPASEILDTRFFGAGKNDGTDECGRMRIAVQRTDDTAFGGITGVGSLTTSASAVIRSTLESGKKAVPAFLILERVRCDALSNSANGSGSFGIHVLGIPATDQPGVIHVDSAANTGCTGNAANSVAVYGTTLSSGLPSINLYPAPVSGELGRLYVVATSNPAKSVPDGINAVPQPGEVVSRAPLDTEFNSTTNPAVPNLHARARTALAPNVSSGVTGDGWKRLGCSLEELDLLDLDRENWYVRCDNYAATTAAINARAVLLGMTPKKILFDGDVSVASSQTLDAETTIAGHVEEVAVKGKVNSSGNLRFGPQVQRVYIGGRDFTNSYKNNSSLLVSGSVAMRATSLPVFADGSVTTVCPTTPVPGRAELVIFGDDSPNLSLTGTAALCNTTVYLAGDTGGGTFSAQQVTSGGTCSTDLPCPRTTGNIADAGTFLFQGGTVDWTAPNATSGEPPAVRGVEDLLFWSESSGTTDVKSGARMVTQGIFVGPNMNMEFRSPALGEPRNAQFIARQLELLQGTLYMRPAPNDSARIPAPGSFVLIR